MLPVPDFYFDQVTAAVLRFDVKIHAAVAVRLVRLFPDDVGHVVRVEVRKEIGQEKAFEPVACVAHGPGYIGQVVFLIPPVA